MSLSWGRAPREDRWRRLAARAASAALLLALALLAGSPASPTDATLYPFTTTERGAPGAVTLYAYALRSGDRRALRVAVDQSRRELRACEEQRLALGREIRPGGQYNVARVEAYGEYARAYVHEAEGWTRYYLRREGARWLITEPRRDEVGGRRERAEGGVTLVWWEIDDDLAGAVLREAQIARTAATALEALADVAPRSPFRTTLYPTRDLGAHASCAPSTIAYGAGGIESAVFDVHLEADLQTIARPTKLLLFYEALHWIQEQRVPGALRASEWWIHEGWPYLRAYTPDRRDRARARLLCVGALPGIERLGSAPALTRSARHRALAASLVEYVSERWGESAYWELLRGSVAEDPRAYERALGVGRPAFYAEWEEWLRRTYCEQ